MRFFKSNRITNLSDAELIAEYKKGNNQAMEILFDRYAHLVYAICFKYLRNEEESRDAVFTIFEKLLSSVKKYEIKNFTTWIHSVTRNYCYELLQKNRNLAVDENIKPEDHADLLANEEPGNDIVFEFIENGTLQEALQSLNEDQKKCVELFYLHKRCYEEITEETGYSLNQVKSYIQNGKRNLKIYLTKKR